MQLSVERRLDSSNPSYSSMDCVIKWSNRFISSIRTFFIGPKVFIMQERKELRRLKKNG